MKNKTKTYLLLVVVLGVWGMIGYKVINGMSPDIAKVNEDNFDISFNPKKNTEIDTFSIKIIERDPFLGTLSSKKIKGTSQFAKSSKKNIENSPLITYGGLIKKQNSSDYVFIVNINNNQYLLKKGQTADSVKLIKGNEKRITIRHGNKNKTIKRQ